MRDDAFRAAFEPVESRGSERSRTEARMAAEQQSRRDARAVARSERFF